MSSHPLDPDNLGRLSHRLIAAMEEGGARDNATIDALAAELLDGMALTHRLAARQRIVSDACVYRDHLAPSAAWQFIGSEVGSGPASHDLLRRTPDGLLVADEVKTNTPPTARAMVRQALGQLAHGRATWGDCFDGVRFCLIRRPNRVPVARWRDGTVTFETDERADAR